MATDNTDWQWMDWFFAPRTREWERERDQVVRAALSDPPAADEREDAVALFTALQRAATGNPARMAAALSAFGDLAVRESAVGLNASTANLDALDADLQTSQDLADVVLWLRTVYMLFERLQDARMTQMQTDHPEAWDECGLLGPYSGPFPWHDQERELLSPDKAAARLGIHPTTLRQWSDQGSVPTIRLSSGRRRYTLAAIERMREQMDLSTDSGAGS